MRVAGEQRLAGRRARARDDPVVAARRLGAEAERVADLEELLGDPEGVALVRGARLGRDRAALRVLRVEPARLLHADAGDELGAEQLGLHVRREAEREQLARRQRVDRRPRLGLDAQELHLERERLGLGDRRVDAGGVGLEQCAGRLVEGGGLALGAAAEAERAHEAVDLEAGLAGELADPAGRAAAEELELPEPVLADGEALPEGEVLARARADVRDAEAVAADRDRLLDAGDRDLAADLRERLAEQAAPGGEGEAAGARDDADRRA